MYKVVSFVDVNELLGFVRNEFPEFEEQVKEEERVKEELKEFMNVIEEYSGHNIEYIGHDKNHDELIVRFLFKDGGFLEVVADKPLTINAHFPDKDSADHFAKGLKKALEMKLPAHPIKDMIINSIKVEDGRSEDVFTIGKWEQMHGIAVRKTVAFTIVALLVAGLIEITREFFNMTLAKFTPHTTIVSSVFVAILVVTIFEPIREHVDKIVSKIFYD